MKVSWISFLVMMMMVFTTYARSLNPNDVPDPPKKPSSRFLPAASAPFARAHFLARDRSPMAGGFRGKNKSKIVVGTKEKSNTKILPPAAAGRASSKALPEIKYKEVLTSKIQPKTSFDASVHHKKRIIMPWHLKGNSFKAVTDEAAETTQAPGGTTTTLDPWEEFCKEACAEGKAGPECDCAEHPIGRRHAPLPEHQLRAPVVVQYVPVPEMETKLRQSPRPVKPIFRPVSPGPIDPDVKPSEGPGEGEHIGGDNVTSTKDPLEEFCQVACKEGQGSLACDCRDHIIG